MVSKMGFLSIIFIGLTLLLKVSGLIRDMVMAYFFGDSYQATAYLAAFVIPNMFILFMVTGMKNALVPSYIEAFQKKRGKEHLGQVFKGTFFICLGIALLGAFLSPIYISILFPNFSQKTASMAIGISIVYFISILFVGMNAVLEGYFDAENRYSLSTVSQIIVIFSTIIGALLFAGKIGPYSLAFGYLTGTIFSLLFKMIWVLPKKTIRFKGKFNFLEIKEFYMVFIPVGLTIAVGQINLTIDNVFASHFSNAAVTYVNYAKNLVHFPQAIFGVTIGTIIFPLISKAETLNDRTLFKRGMEKGLTTMFFILFPSVVGMLLLMPEIINILFQRGHFDHAATLATSSVAYFYFGSVLFFSIQVIIDKGFYTLKKGNLILYISGFAILLKLLLNFLFTQWIGYHGIPLSSSVMAFVYAGVSFVIFVRLIGGLNLKRMGLEYSKVVVASLVMALIIYWFKPLILPYGTLLTIICVAVLGTVIYGLCVFILKAEALSLMNIGKTDR